MYILTMNKYYEFLEKIIRDFRSSSYEMENKYEIRGFSVKMSELKKNPNRKLTQKSISDIEKALNIVINDTDKNNIMYHVKGVNEYSVGKLGTSAHELTSVDDIHIGLKNMDTIYFIRMKEEYITDIYKVGQAIIFDPLGEIEDNDELIIKLVNSQIMIKQCTLDGNNLLYVDKNDDYKIRKIPFKETECYFKIIGSMKLAR